MSKPLGIPHSHIKVLLKLVGAARTPPNMA